MVRQTMDDAATGAVVHATARGVAMNRKQRLADRVRAPRSRGGFLVPLLFLVLDSDRFGRPTKLRVMHDDETLEDVLREVGMLEQAVSVKGAPDDPSRKLPHFLTVWVPEGERWRT